MFKRIILEYPNDDEDDTDEDESVEDDNPADGDTDLARCFLIVETSG